MIERLRFFGRLVRSASPFLKALLAGPAAERWRAALSADLALLHASLPEQLGYLGPPVLPAIQWQKLVATQPKAWLGLLRTFLKQVVSDAGLALRVRRALRPGSSDETMAAPALEVEGHFCYECAANFATFQQLRLHQHRVHQLRRPARDFVIDGRCPACSGQYHTRLRAMHHLEVAIGCRRKMEEGELQAHPPEVIEAADQLDTLARRAARSTGVSERLAAVPAQPSRP